MFYLLLEILRIILLLLIFVGFFGTLLGCSYSFLGFNLNNINYGWLAWIAIISLFFVLYRNKLQYSGWYIGEAERKLHRRGAGEAKRQVCTTAIKFGKLNYSYLNW
ncbi:hypothetical protein BC351_04885 [Paenibacillus ferrarius]|uniref:Uncharacterized protein n=1 Tax=Paenibacillus ferrarius TaxID=1469647 RepID=A0A1V4HMA0_9BACL|nr:hypothetical protein [Paenibacillus ferrarius]OPH57834.1 hypothetical protein BC351_04885 [Paenibacillus ferrarius]